MILRITPWNTMMATHPSLRVLVVQLKLIGLSLLLMEESIIDDLIESFAKLASVEV